MGFLGISDPYCVCCAWGPAKLASETPGRQEAAPAGVSMWAPGKGALKLGLGSGELWEGGRPGQAIWTTASPSPSQVRLLCHSVCLSGTAGSGLQHGALLFHSGPASPPAAQVTGAGAGWGKPWDWSGKWGGRNPKIHKPRVRDAPHYRGIRPCLHLWGECMACCASSHHRDPVAPDCGGRAWPMAQVTLACSRYQLQP